MKTDHVWLEDVNAWEKGTYGMLIVTPEGDTHRSRSSISRAGSTSPDGTWKTHMTMTFPFVEPEEWPEQVLP